MNLVAQKTVVEEEQNDDNYWTILSINLKFALLIAVSVVLLVLMASLFVLCRIEK